MNINITIPLEDLQKAYCSSMYGEMVAASNPYKVNSSYKVGDVINFTLKTGEEVHAMAMKQEADGMIFCFIDCLKKERPMNDDTDIDGFIGTDLCDWLNIELVKEFPDDIYAKMIPFDDGIYVRLPTEKEMFGKNCYGAKEPDYVEQWQPMKIRRNRISFQGKNGDSFAWPWLSTPVKDSASHFAHVSLGGLAAYDHASYSFGVRPAFKIRNL